MSDMKNVGIPLPITIVANFSLSINVPCSSEPMGSTIIKKMKSKLLNVTKINRRGRSNDQHRKLEIAEGNYKLKVL